MDLKEKEPLVKLDICTNHLHIIHRRNSICSLLMLFQSRLMLKDSDSASSWVVFIVSVVSMGGSLATDCSPGDNTSVHIYVHVVLHNYALVAHVQGGIR